MAMLAFNRPLGAVRDLIIPGLWSIRAWADPSIKEVDIRTNLAEDTIELAVVHTLFTRNEIDDGSFKQSFRGRLERALLADGVPNGRQLTVERRSFLARAARIRKAKPMKARS